MRLDNSFRVFDLIMISEEGFSFPKSERLFEIIFDEIYIYISGTINDVNNRVP